MKTQIKCKVCGEKSVAFFDVKNDKVIHRVFCVNRVCEKFYTILNYYDHNISPETKLLCLGMEE